MPELTERLWLALRGAPALAREVSFGGGAANLPSRFEVGELAAACVAVATLAVAELWSARTKRAVRAVRVDRRLAGASFRAEKLLKPQGWTPPERYDPLMGDYRGRDGWIRLHTNYPNHREVAMRVLDRPVGKQAVADAVSRWSVVELESAIVEQGGCAAALRTREQWLEHPQGSALAAEPLVAWDEARSGRKLAGDADAPLAGLRVLDLTRVIAGPVGTRFLAAHGAQVLRIDPPGFAEGISLLCETALGKRRATLDLKTAAGRKVFDGLVRRADLLMHGYRPGALEALGYPERALRALKPDLTTVCHDAYGWSGPWAKRRGFDSLVQNSSGIAHPGSDGVPTPMPAQALDHGTGHLLAAAACRALTDGVAGARLSLARTATELVRLGVRAQASPAGEDSADLYEKNETAWGPVLQVRHPAEIDGYRVRWPHRAGPLGSDEPSWQ